MKLRAPQAYHLELFDEGPYRLSLDGVKSTFSKPASTHQHPKLYTLSADGKLLYVGIASQPMSSRLSFGFRAKGKGGYHGYKWKNLRHRLALSIWTAEHEGTPTTLRDLETVEAEVAFLCRQQSGQWPEFQHEIHFYPSFCVHREAAQEIYAHAILRSS
ncbi:hypothetical protein [Pseudomonas kilonensis]|uniref:hypothetical protein n=1 Tax=Pseudomonas kilonensis TaxID=132476 RepID=UPI0016407D9C|nr:hypothetical protein [Pseudomonas kilonensis]